MPWEVCFDIDETLEKAMNTFWQYGYNGTSMQDLVQSMEINPGSIYRTYGNKREIFLQALKYYNKTAKKRLSKFENKAHPYKSIINFFEHVKKEVLEGEGDKGCFVINSSLEVAPHDKEVNELVQQGQQDTRDFFYRLINSAIKKGEVSKKLNAHQASDACLSLLIGVRVLMRTNPARRQIDGIIQNVKVILQSN